LSSALSFQGISSGVQTDALVSAIMAQDSLPLVRLQNQQNINNNRTAALNTMQTDMTNLATSLQTLQFTGSGFDARTVSSSDTTATYVSATASGATTGNYDVQVTSVATSGRILPTLNASNQPNLAVADPSGGGSSQIFTPGGTPASFAIQGTDGSIKTITLTSGNNSLNGLASAINASFAGSTIGAGVTASVVNTGTGATPYQLVLTANQTGTGKTSGIVTIADVTSNDGSTSDNLIGITAGKVNSMTAPTTLTGGLNSAAATNAVFSVNGIQLTRQTNSVNDAVDGMTFTLKQGGQTGKTTLTVGEDTSTITATMQDVISKYNTLVNDYKTSSTATKDSKGGIIPAALSNDSTARSMISQIQSLISGIPSSISPTAAYKSIGDLGITSNSDGTLKIDTAAFTKALTADPSAAKAVFDFTGTTDNGVASFSQGTAATTAQKIAFTISTFDGNSGSWTGTLTADGGTPVAVTGTKDGLITAAASGTSLGALSGLRLAVTGTGSGTLSLTKGVAQSAQDLVSNLTGHQGTIWNTLASIKNTNTSLASQISQEQTLLDSTQAQLETQFAAMEATVAQLKAATQGLAGA
jgi:flagellar hook-associated protein 2